MESLPSPYLVCPSAEELIERLWTGEEAETRAVELNYLSITLCPLSADSRLPVGPDDDWSLQDSVHFSSDGVKRTNVYNQ